MTRLGRDTQGNVAMMFSLSVLGLLTVVGAAIDYSGMTKAKVSLQAQVDAGVLAAARLQPTKGRLTVKNSDRKTVVNEVMAQNGFDAATGKTIIRIANPTITVKAQSDYKTAFMGMIGKSTVKIGAKAQSQINAGGTLEIALVLDNTGSMTINGKLDALKVGAKGLLGTLESFPADKVTVSIVPFARYVNVGSDKRDATWLDMPDEYTVTRNEPVTTTTGGTPANCTETGVMLTGQRDGASYQYPEKSCTGGSAGTSTTTNEDRDYTAEWTGCVGVRPAGLHIEDSTYSTAVPGLTGFEAKERKADGLDRRNNCPRAITALTNDFPKLKSDIDALRGGGNTYMPIGIAWGTRVLSPGEPFAQASATAKDVRKLMIVMTDGNNTIHLDTPPYLDSNNASTSTTLEENANKDTVTACNNAKASGFEVITIAFQVTDKKTKTMLGECASSRKNYFDAGDNAKLIATFEKIGARLNEVRLTQ